MMLFNRNREFESAIRVANQYLEGKAPNTATTVQLVAYYTHFLAGNWLAAKDLIAVVAPELFEADGARVHQSNFWNAINLAYIYLQTDETEKATELIDKIWPFLKDGERIVGVGYAIDDVRLYVMQGDLERATTMLAEAIEMGWRGNWYISLHLDPVLRPLHTDPEYQQLVAIVEADIRSQQQWLIEHVDDPLL